MKHVAIVFCLIGIRALAFDSAAWLEKRALLQREADRLRAAYTNCVAQAQEPAEDVTIPIETFPDGAVKAFVHAEKAVYFLDRGLVWASGVKIIKYDRDGTVDAQIDARACVVDRYTKSGWADGPARIKHGTTEFRGEDIYFSSPEGYVMVTKNSDVQSTDLKFGGVGP